MLSIFWNSQCFRHAFVVSVLTRHKCLICVVAHLALCASAHAFLFPSLCVATLWLSTCALCGPHDRLSHSRHGKNKTARIHPPYFINLVAEPMEAIHAVFVRLATELEAVKGQVQTECNALRDLFARTTTAMSSSVLQHDKRLTHREAGRHLPQQFGGSRLDSGDFAFRMEGHAAVLSRDGQGGALLREVAKLEKFEDNTIEILGENFLGCSTINWVLWQLLLSRAPVEKWHR